MQPPPTFKVLHPKLVHCVGRKRLILTCPVQNDHFTNCKAKGEARHDGCRASDHCSWLLYSCECGNHGRLDEMEMSGQVRCRAVFVVT